MDDPPIENGQSGETVDADLTELPNPEDDSTVGRVFSWGKENPAPALTLLGLAIYVALRLPYSIYYGRLGTTPEDVGLSYIEVLAQSTVGALTVVVLVSVVAVILSLLAFLGVLYASILKIYPHVRRSISLQTKEQLSKYEIDQLSEIVREIYGPSIIRETFVADVSIEDEMIPRLRDTWSKPRRERDADYRDMRAEGLVPKFGVRRAVGMGLRKYRGRATLVSAVVVLFAFLPILALVAADLVRSGAGGSPVARFGLFGMRGDPSCVQMEGETLGPVMFLGRGPDQVVFFDPGKSETLRLPGESVVIRSSLDADSQTLSC